MPNVRMLRLALLGDAAACAACGLVLAAGAGALAGPLGLPEPLLRWVGLGLLPWAAFVGLTGWAASPWQRAAWAIVALNALWVLDSLLLAAGAFGLAPTGLGIAFILAQAVMGAGFAVVQALALRRVPVEGLA
ncbi:hypothetical protein ACLF3G_00330 [Falsiroseomonas sp. HC035]|uniref:hypothetical protein n=1 Tax=Falsiroseomonas sp. HC035 TaxID=3390999 RepID=UPI003D3194BE